MGRRMLLTRPAALQRGAGCPWRATRVLCSGAAAVPLEREQHSGAGGIWGPAAAEPLRLGLAGGVRRANGVLWPPAAAPAPAPPAAAALREHHTPPPGVGRLRARAASRCARHGVAPISTRSSSGGAWSAARRLASCRARARVLRCCMLMRLGAASARCGGASSPPGPCVQTPAAGLPPDAAMLRCCAPRAMPRAAKMHRGEQHFLARKAPRRAPVPHPRSRCLSCSAPSSTSLSLSPELLCAHSTGQLLARRCHRQPARAARCLLHASGVKIASARVPPRAKACGAARQCVHLSRRSPPTRPEQQPLAQLPARRASAASRSRSGST